MLTSSSSYKMSKSTKRILASSDMLDRQLRGEYRRLMIEAELHASVRPRSEKKLKSDQNSDSEE